MADLCGEQYEMKVPGIVYSLLVALGAWAVEYFTTGAGNVVPWAPILLATIPVVLKLFTVMTETTESNQRELMRQPSKTQKLLFG